MAVGTMAAAVLGLFGGGYGEILAVRWRCVYDIARCAETGGGGVYIGV